MITGKLVQGTTITTPTTVYTSSGTNAITTMVLCNTGAPDPTDELVNSVTVNIYLIDPSSGGDNATVNAGALVVSNLIVPAGETVFFSEERMVLDNNDYVAVGYKMTDSGASPVNNLLTVTVSTLSV